ncbi:MAG TPA: septal ring lytic transglycosylase RlpA family protein [Spongiibacteraceae bacterium]|nr:septal ring lytic transglycosylase RlpA family protein [Spongiibacteraceae bacterium]
MLLAACGGTPTRDGTPLRKLDPSAIKDAVPRRDPVTSAGNKSPYTVLGKTYVLLPTAKGYRATGIASWYGTKFHGQSTSNGEKYDVYDMTAAHKTLPIPCYVLVTNLENNRQAVVRVNDRGPFVSNRIIDLSYAAAVKLGYADKGTAFVEVRTIDVDNWPPRDAPDVAPAVTPPLAPPPPPLPVPVSPAAAIAPAAGVYVQVGAFSDRRAAEALRERLADVQNEAVVVQPTPSSPVLYRVRIGPLRDRAAAEQLRDQLLGSHISEAARVVEGND